MRNRSLETSFDAQASGRQPSGRRPRVAVVALLLLVGIVGAVLTAPAASSHGLDAHHVAATSGPYVTFLFSRTEMTAADACVANNTGVARLDTVVAPYLAARGWTGTGTLVTGKTRATATSCVHTASSLTASWAQATSLADRGWSFTSHTATYPASVSGLTPAQSQTETCGSADTIDQHGLPGGHGMISYPGAQDEPVALQTDYAANCFAWGRQYGSEGVTFSAAGHTAPYWQHTIVVNGGPCNVKTRPCYTVSATGGSRYQLPSRFIGYIKALTPGQWFTLQAYLLVTGKNPAYSSSPIRWDCTAADPRLHWTNDNERYCYKDWQSVVNAVSSVPGVVVTDPLTVGIAFGRPASYP